MTVAAGSAQESPPIEVSARLGTLAEVSESYLETCGGHDASDTSPDPPQVHSIDQEPEMHADAAARSACADANVDTGSSPCEHGIVGFQEQIVHHTEATNAAVNPTTVGSGATSSLTGPEVSPALAAVPKTRGPVSYTHLTLPTILLV